MRCGLLLLIAAMAPAAADTLIKADSAARGNAAPAASTQPNAVGLAALGRRLFFDPGLSASGAISCATCHDATRHFAPGNALAVQLGGLRLDRQGVRATPSLMYAATTPFFTEHRYDSDDEGNEALDQGPTGGRTWDGRVDRPRDQAGIPLLDANEMANANEAAVVARVTTGPHAAELRQLYGEAIFVDTRRAFLAIGAALEAYQETPEEFSPFTSKYDAFLRGKATLSAQEIRGLAAFNDPARGNCNQCHRSQLTPRGQLPLFTDFGLIAVGVPRNPRIAANTDPQYFDLGACGPLRRDLTDRPEYCGLFKTPTLRNVATRKAFYHNGVFSSLEQAVAFYATRDTNPERWYPVGPDGRVRKFDDLPARYQGNINHERPFGQQPGEQPVLSPQDVTDIVAFLGTLTDGYASPPQRSLDDQQTPGSGRITERFSMSSACCALAPTLPRAVHQEPRQRALR